jgi:hypothetical protein
LLGFFVAFSGASPQRVTVIGWLVGLVGGAVYEIAFHASPFQATIGKLALRVKVTDRHGARISVARSIGRYFAKWVSSLTFGVGLVMAGFTRRRQALHDLLAQTLVVHNAAPAEIVAAAPLARHVGAAGVALLILFGLLPYLLFGFAVAWTGWNELKRRAELAESQASPYPSVSQTDLEAGRRQIRAALFAVQPYKATLGERIASGVPMDDVVPEELRGALEVESPNVESVDILKGAILIVFGDDALVGLAGKQLALVPGRRLDGSAAWVCGYAQAPRDTSLVFEDHFEYTSVDEVYLPEICR